MNSMVFLQHLTAQPTYAGQIAHIEHIPPRDADCAELDKPLVSNLQDCLNEHGLLPLYTPFPNQGSGSGPVARFTGIILP